MFGLIKKVFMRLLISKVNASNHLKCVPLNNHKCMIQSTLINLDPNEVFKESCLNKQKKKKKRNLYF